MKHQLKGNRLGRSAKHLSAMLRNMSSSLFLCEAIRTTVPKARELKIFAEKTITQAKHGNIDTVRARTYEEKVVQKIMFDIAPRYAEREGGYTRMLKCGFRKGDVAEMAVVELVGRVGEIRPRVVTSSPPPAKSVMNTTTNSKEATK